MAKRTHQPGGTVEVITADQLLCHLFGDYVFQSDWMASEKVKQNAAALCHAAVYGLCFLPLRPSLAAWLVIVGTHFVIDRWRLARFVVYVKNFLSLPYTVEWVKEPNSEEAASPDGFVTRAKVTDWWHKWADCSATGYHKDKPAWLTVWLMILADNALHILVNGLAFKYLGDQ